MTRSGTLTAVSPRVAGWRSVQVQVEPVMEYRPKTTVGCLRPALGGAPPGRRGVGKEGGGKGGEGKDGPTPGSLPRPHPTPVGVEV